MKLSTINAIKYPKFNIILYTLLNNTTSKLTIEQYVFKHNQIAIYFVESILQSNILNEAKTNYLDTLLDIGLSKLQTLMSPGINRDAEAILGIMLPQFGGVQALNSLINDAANTKDALVNNDSWWIKLFKIFNINDQQTQNNIKNKFIFTNPQIPNPQLSSQSADLQFIIDKATKRKEKANEKIAELNKRIKELMIKKAYTTSPKSPTVESVLNNIVELLLNEHIVQNNLNIIVPKFRQLCGISTIFNEIKLKQIKNFITNPKLVKKSVQLRNNNIRFAKHAIQLIIDRMRIKFNNTLQSAGLNPLMIINSYYKWKKLKQQNLNTTEFKELSNKLSQTYKLFN